MTDKLDFFLLPFLEGVLILYNVVPFSRFWTYRFWPTGILKLVIHRKILEKCNLYRVPVTEFPKKLESFRRSSSSLRRRSKSAFGTDLVIPTAGMEGSWIGRNMPALPKHLRDPHGKPDVQLIAQRLLARDDFKPAGSQLNILAASWIQAMVHDWIGHFDGRKVITVGSRETESLCPFARNPFRFKETEDQPGGFYRSNRSMWWDGSFVYGNSDLCLNQARLQVNGKVTAKMKVNTTPNLLVEKITEKQNGTSTSIYATGDNQNSWVGVALLQDLFLREHNFICDRIADGKMTEDEIFDKARIIISALIAKIHTTDWTVELLDTRLLEIGMNTNWDGLAKTLGFSKPEGLFSKMGEKKGKQANNQGTPFCLTEEFAAVYRLHSLSPPGLFVGDGEDPEFIELSKLIGNEGRAQMKKTEARARQMMKAVLSWPCGNLVSNNYPNAFRNLTPTDKEGHDLKEEENIDLAALDLFRDRERGILKFNEFRRKLFLKPYYSWMELTGGNAKDAKKLELIYGPGQGGIEKLDLLVGDMYERKPMEGFALSETSFIIFLLMASRRLDSDRFLNEYYTEKTYTAWGLAHVKSNKGLYDLLERHYPELTIDFIDEKGHRKKHHNRDHSCFRPTIEGSKWKKMLEKSTNRDAIKLRTQWESTKKANADYFKKTEKETRIYTQNQRSNVIPVFSFDWIYITIAILLVVVPFCVMFTLEHPDNENPNYSIHSLWPINMPHELAFSSVRHTKILNKVLHIFTNPIIYISQTYLLDQTPALCGIKINLPGFKNKLNAAAFYFLYISIYACIVDRYSGILHILYLMALHKCVPSLGEYLRRVVGPNVEIRCAFFLYAFSQLIQPLLGHAVFEDFSDTNIYHVFMIQQQITVLSIMEIFKIYPSFFEEVNKWMPVFQECMGNANFNVCAEMCVE